MCLQVQQNELADARALLKSNEDARKKVVNEKNHLDKALAETTAKLDDLKQRSALRVDELDRDLSAAKTKEVGLQAKQREIMQQLEDEKRRCEAAKTEAESYRKSKVDTETSLEKEKRSCQNLQKQLQEMQQETGKQLEDAARRYEAAEVEIESWKKAKADTEASLEKEKLWCQNLQQMQRETSKQLEDAEGHKKETCARSNVEASLNESKQLCQTLQQKIIYLEADLRRTILGRFFIFVC